MNADDPVDYPDVGAPVAEAVAEGKYDLGLLVCGTAPEWRSWPTRCPECARSVFRTPTRPSVPSPATTPRL